MVVVGASEMTAVGRVDFFANVDGPWPLRSRADFGVQLDQLAIRLRLVAAGGVHRGGDELSVGEQFTIGVKDAAAWTLGISSKAPFVPGVTVVSDSALGARVADAQLMVSLGAEARYYAAGVRAWLFWLTGVVESVEYPV